VCPDLGGWVEISAGEVNGAAFIETPLSIKKASHDVEACHLKMCRLT
jgi:hypothetical protein